MNTDQLIVALTAELAPVRRLRPPAFRTFLWLLVALPWIALVVTVVGPRDDLPDLLGDRSWMFLQMATFATAMSAAMAAFCAGVPGRPRWEHFVPAVPFALWLSVPVVDLLDSLKSGDVAQLAFAPDWICLPGVILVGFGPGAAMVLALRRGAPVHPGLAAFLGGLAAAALGSFGLQLFHPQDASLMVLVWQIGSVMLLTLMSAGVGHRLLTWKAVIGEASGFRRSASPHVKQS